MAVRRRENSWRYARPWILFTRRDGSAMAERDEAVCPFERLARPWWTVDEQVSRFPLVSAKLAAAPGASAPWHPLRGRHPLATRNATRSRRVFGWHDRYGTTSGTRTDRLCHSTLRASLCFQQPRPIIPREFRRRRGTTKLEISRVPVLRALIIWLSRGSGWLFIRSLGKAAILATSELGKVTLVALNDHRNDLQLHLDMRRS